MATLIVSNRLPFSVRVNEGELSFEGSSGGLVSGMTSYLESGSAGDSIWIAWPGNTIPEELHKPLAQKAIRDYHSYPVFLTEEAMQNFYHGFCNKTIWPLFHYFPSYALFEEEFWQQYKAVNQTFCDAVLEIAKPGDTIWIHDYHLMLLPELLRQKLPDASIGFFLHIPFPSFEIFRLLPGPWRAEILKGLLGADLVGFHTYSYTQYFLRSVLRVLGYESNMRQVMLKDRIVAADTFPLGIDYRKFHEAAGQPEILERRRQLKSSLGHRTLVLSLDRLDYTKGILNRLRGYELFLDWNPEWRNKVVLILVVVPSRVGVRHYQQQKRQIDQLVGKINGKYGSTDWTPIVYQYRSVSFSELVSIYSACEVALVTPLRDGMNLISKEYIASSWDQTGVLILSEMAGAATELGEALIVNPNEQEIAITLKDALNMPRAERMRRNAVMQRRLKRYSVTRWASDFLQKLESIKELQLQSIAKILNETTITQLIEDYMRAKHRLLFLAYDGTLVPFSTDPAAVHPDEGLLEILNELTVDPLNDVVLITGRDRATLEKWFDAVPGLMLVGEGGMLFKEPGMDWISASPFTSAWKTEILPVLELFVDRLPGSFIEEKEFSLAWHYRKSEAELSMETARRLADHLMNITRNMNLQILSGDKVIEVRYAGINKGTAAARWLTRAEYDFVLAIGQNWTDEDMFRAVPPNAYSIRVGLGQTQANYSVKSELDVRRLLARLTAAISRHELTNGL